MSNTQASLQELEQRLWEHFKAYANQPHARWLNTPGFSFEAQFNSSLAKEKVQLTDEERQQLYDVLLAELAGFGPLEPILADPAVMEIMVDGPDHIRVERRGKIEDVPQRFRDEDHLIRIIERILTPCGLKLDESHPIVDARLSDGSRVNVVGRPIAVNGPAMTIRKFARKMWSIEDLIGFGSWTEDMVTFLRACVLARLNMVVSGGTGSGKTTVMNLICGMIPPDERIITVEHASELQLTQPRVVSLESRPPNLEGRGEVSMYDLAITAMKMRPDRIIAGEVHGREAAPLFLAMNTGYDGAMCTVHANSLRDVLARMEVMASQGDPATPLLGIREQMASAIDLITYQERLRDGVRRLVKITEVTGMLEGGVISTQDIFEFRQTGVENGKVQGFFTATGNVPRCLEQIREAGVELPMSLFTPHSG